MVDQEPFSEHVAEGVRAGDPDALGACWRALAAPLVTYLHAQVRDAGVAEDLAQETFLELVRSCRSIRGGPRELRSWVYRAALRNVLDWRRRWRRRPEDAHDELPERDHPERIDEAVAERDQAARVRAAVAALPPDQAEVITLRFLAQLSAPEAAAVLGKTEGAVRAAQHRAMANLGRRLAPGAAQREPSKPQAVPVRSPWTPEWS